MSKKRDHRELEKRRKGSVRLFKKGYGAAEVGRRLGVTRQVAHRWKQAWEQGGQAALTSKGPAGPKSKLSSKQMEQVTQALLQGPRSEGYRTDLWTLPRVTVLIKKLTGVVYHPGHVWRVLGSMGFSCQRPERRAIERDDKQVRAWRRNKWPALKKRPSSRGESLSLLMKVD